MFLWGGDVISVLWGKSYRDQRATDVAAAVVVETTVVVAMAAVVGEV